MPLILIFMLYLLWLGVYIQGIADWNNGTNDSLDSDIGGIQYQ
jgi:hypothetical protein